MADYYREQRDGVPEDMVTKYRDFDTYHAEVLTFRDEWTLQVVSDEADKDSDKNLNVPANRDWQILWVWVEYLSGATVGNRNLCLTLYDDNNDIIGEYRAGAVQTASTQRYYMFAPAVADLTAFRDTNYLMSCIAPTTFLKANYHIRVWDCNAVSVAMDDMYVQMMVAWRPA